MALSLGRGFVLGAGQGIASGADGCFRAEILGLILFRHIQGPGISMELSKDSTYDEVCEALTERLREEGQAETLHLEDPQQLRFTGQQSWTATIPKTAPFKWRQWDALHQVHPVFLLVPSLAEAHSNRASEGSSPGRQVYALLSGAMKCPAPVNIVTGVAERPEAALHLLLM